MTYISVFKKFINLFRYSLVVSVLMAQAMTLVLAQQPQQQLQQESQQAQEEAHNLEVLLAEINSFKANVTQMIVESDGGVLEESKILFMLERPDGFYWETLEPFPELLVTNGIKLWNYQPDLLQVSIENWDPEQAELAAQLFNGQFAEIREDYQITAQSAADGEDREFFLKPLDSGSVYERVSLYFKQGVIDSIHIDHGNGQKTLWQFYDKQLNLDIADEVFQFTPPADIEVIDNSF
ncbi:MAG: outer membrane lipoprotein chaperone LolA [Pseudomonadales bacterium]|nr:outer membrane lipoprotein chaperone LolA [Pseudomonadales bacterium]